MHSKGRLPNVMFGASLRAESATLAILILLLFLVFVLLFLTLTAQPAHAQTYKVLHNFTGGQDGGNPYAGLTMDKVGNLYGTSALGGIGYGTVFQLKHKGSGWTFNPLYSFAGGGDGAYPKARVIFGPDSSLYGTAYEGGSGCSGYGCGTVFKLRPSPTACKTALCGWTKTVVYGFQDSPDGALPRSDLIFDQPGNIYGTTAGGHYGVVHELTPSGSGWTERVLYGFSGGGSDGAYPYGGVISDNAGNLYGTTLYGEFFGPGTVFQLTPSGSGWRQSVLYSFQGGDDGRAPWAGLILDPSGNLYGATSNGGQGGGGTVFKLTPSNGSWTYSLVYSFTGMPSEDCGPFGTLSMDGAGNLYGTTYCDGANNAGSVFKLTPSGNSWTYTSLHDFTGGNDGENPISNVVFDANGDLYGTTESGGAYGYGVAFEITP